MDHIPESILHHRLSYLDSPKQLVRMSVVSKHWLVVTDSFPVFNFDIGKFISVVPMADFHNILDMFLKYVDCAALRFHKQNFTSAHTLKLRTWIMKPTQADLIDRCLGLILMKGVKVLEVNITDAEPLCRVPNIVLSASSLTSLNLCKCELPSSIMVDVIKFNSLRQLELYRVPLDEEVIKRLTASCPLLEKLVVQDCHGYKKFMIYGLKKLQEVKFLYDREVEMINIEAPNLCNLGLDDSEKRGALSMDQATCKNLRTLNLGWFTFPTSYGFSDLLPNFPLLEVLFLSLPDHCNSLRIDAGTLWVQTLSQFLDKKHRFKVLKLSFRSTYSNDVEELELIRRQPLELDHVELDLHSLLQLSDYVTIVHVVLWCCRPRSLKLNPDFDFIDIDERSRCWIM